MENYLVEHFNTEKNVIFYRVYAKGAEYLYNINLVERNLRYLSVPDYMYVDTRTNEMVQIQLSVQNIFIRDEDENGNLIIYRMATQYEFDKWLATGFGGKNIFDRKLQSQLMKPKNRHAYTLINYEFDKYFSQNNDHESPIYTNEHYRFKPDFNTIDEKISFIRFIPKDEQQKMIQISDSMGKDMGINNIDISEELNEMTHENEIKIKNEFDNIPKFDDLMEPLLDDMFSPIYWMRRKYAKVFMDPKKKYGKNDDELKLPKRVMFRHKDDPRRFDDDDDVFNVVTTSEIPNEVIEGLELEGDDNEAISLMSRKETNNLLIKQEIFKAKFDQPLYIDSSAPMPRKVAAAMRKDPLYRAKIEADIKKREEDKKLQKLRDKKRENAEQKIANARAMAEAAAKQLHIATSAIQEIEEENTKARIEKIKIDEENNFIKLLNTTKALSELKQEDDEFSIKLPSLKKVEEKKKGKVKGIKPKKKATKSARVEDSGD
jgi:hypothetical protein